jgi:hypothetical protein
MSETTRRKTDKDKLHPTPAQERTLEDVLRRCRDLYNTALERRIIAYQRLRVSLSRYQQEAELTEIRAAFPEYEAIHSHALQDALARLRGRTENSPGFSPCEVSGWTPRSGRRKAATMRSLLKQPAQRQVSGEWMKGGRQGRIAGYNAK